MFQGAQRNESFQSKILCFVAYARNWQIECLIQVNVGACVISTHKKVVGLNNTVGLGGFSSHSLVLQ